MPFILLILALALLVVAPTALLQKEMQLEDYERRLCAEAQAKSWEKKHKEKTYERWVAA
jgi:hypothetical protein